MKDPELKQYYQYTYFIQINLSSVNGIKTQRVEASEASSVSDVPRAKSIECGAADIVLVQREESKEEWTMLDDGGNKGIVQDNEAESKSVEKQSSLLQPKMPLPNKKLSHEEAQ